MVEWSGDTSAADWWVERLHPFATDLGSVVPEGFEAYARVLHPWRGGLRWAQLAADDDTPLKVTTQREELEASAAARGAGRPCEGSLEAEHVGVLVELLASFTGTPRSCWFGVWEGYGWMSGLPAVSVVTSHPTGRGSSSDESGLPELPPPPPPGPRVHVPGRSYALHRGPVEAALAFCRPLLAQSPNVWWPEDRAWFVATEIDFCSTYLGGPRALVERVLADGRLEALRAEVSDVVRD